MLRASLLAPSAPEALLETNRALELLLDKVRSFDGTIEGRGPTGIAAAFGLDPAEDTPSRAAHAAMAMVNAVTRARQEAGAGPAIKVAVHTSQMLVGRGAGAPELDLEGKQSALIVLNALVERGGADSVMVSEATAPFLTRGFEFLELRGEEFARGRAYALLGRGRTGPGYEGRASTFVGRNRELELLSSRLESAVRGRGQIVGISGEAGIGKSRLIYEFRDSLVGKAVTCLVGHCHSHGTAVPYLPILDVLRAACGITESDAPAVAADKVRTTLIETGMDLLDTAPYLLHLLDIEHDAERFAGAHAGRDEGADLRDLASADTQAQPAGDRSSSSSRICTGSTAPRRSTWPASPRFFRARACCSCARTGADTDRRGSRNRTRRRWPCSRSRPRRACASCDPSSAASRRPIRSTSSSSPRPRAIHSSSRSWRGPSASRSAAPRR
jgi:hypothetical protein